MQRLTAATIAALLGLALTASGTLTAKNQATPKPAPPKPAAAGAAQAAPNYQVEVLWPKPFAAAAPTTSRDRSWRFSGRWWARPVAVRRDRPWR